jgi:hypothetical protein
MSMDDVNKFLKEQGAKAFAFEKVGDTVSGEIVAADLRQQTSMDTNEPLFWQTGQPRNLLVLTLQTNMSDNDNDDGQRTVWLRGGNFTVASGSGTSSLLAVKDAMRRAGVSDIEIGAHLTMTHTGMGKPSNKGFNAPKLYTAEYRAAVRNVSLEDLT